MKLEQRYDLAGRGSGRRLTVKAVRALGLAAAVVALSACGAQPSSKGAGAGLADLAADRLVDLTHPFDDSTIYWPTEVDGFQLDRGAAGVTERGFFYAANRMALAEHGGTHIDAPYHFYETGRTVDEIPLEQLIGPGVVIDVRESCRENPDYQVSVADVTAWEEANGRLPDGVIVLLLTGHGAYWPDRERYMATADLGADAVGRLHFPGLHPHTALWLTENRSIAAIGLDTPSIDFGQSTLFESHVTLFSRNIPALENVAHLDRLPAVGFDVIVLPMKIRGGTGGPARIIAVLAES